MDVSIDRRALDRMVRTSPAAQAIFTRSAKAIRDQARANATSIDPVRTGALAYEVGEDEQGLFADIGYSKSHPGWVLWFHEVGTVNHPASPHLRPAVSAGRF